MFYKMVFTFCFLFTLNTFSRLPFTPNNNIQHGDRQDQDSAPLQQRPIRSSTLP